MLPLRGLSADTVPVGNWMPVVLYVVGMLGYVAAGLAVLGTLLWLGVHPERAIEADSASVPHSKSVTANAK